MVKIEHPLSKNMELVSTHDLNGQPGFQMALQVVDGHYYLYVTTYYHQGWQILDVTDPTHMICKHLDDPRGKSGTVHPKIQIADGIMITASGQRVRFLPMEGVDYDDYDSGIEIWDVKTDPMNPTLLGYWDNSGGEGIDGNNTHRNYYDGGRYVYTTSTCPGFLNNILRIIDIIDPAHPKEVGRWYLKEQWLDGMDHVEWDVNKIQPGSLSPYPGYKHYHLHMPQVKDGYAYLAYCGYGLVILDVHDVTRPKYVGSLKIDPPFSDFISCHTALPMSGYNKDYLILTQEMGGDGRHAQFAGIVDISDKEHPTLVSMFPPYSVPEDAPFKNSTTSKPVEDGAPFLKLTSTILSPDLNSFLTNGASTKWTLLSHLPGTKVKYLFLTILCLNCSCKFLKADLLLATIRHPEVSLSRRWANSKNLCSGFRARSASIKPNSMPLPP